MRYVTSRLFHSWLLRVYSGSRLLGIVNYRYKVEFKGCGMGGEAMTITMREFKDGDEQAFRRLNEEWIGRYFKMEATDESAFAHPREKYLDGGGRIFFTLRDDEIIGCCALMPMAKGEFELSKMAITASAQGTGAGRFQLQGVVDAARTLGAKRLYLETNHVLGPAIHLYEAVGFTHVPVERLTPSPYARADVFMEMWLSG